METLLLKRSDVARLLSIEECMIAVEKAFCLHAEGKIAPPKLMGLHAANGGFHIKSGLFENAKNYFVTKINANFPNNAKQFALPTIQGVIALFDAANGRLLALMDSIEITIIRTGAATGLAAKYLSLPNSTIVTICGCGNQGMISLKALMTVRNISKIFAFDIDKNKQQKIFNEYGERIEVIPIGANDLAAAFCESDIIVSCTPSREAFIGSSDVKPGTFIAAVGADSEEKQELFPDLVASSKIVADLVAQSAEIGEVHHAIRKGLMKVDDIHAELGAIMCGKKNGRESSEEIIIFDSTGTALQDVAAAIIVYEKALALGTANVFDFSEADRLHKQNDALLA